MIVYSVSEGRSFYSVDYCQKGVEVEKLGHFIVYSVSEGRSFFIYKCRLLLSERGGEVEKVAPWARQER